VGALLLIFLGVRNIYETRRNKLKTELTSAPLIGLGVGIDAGIACLSFSLSFYNAFAIAIVMSIFHGAFFVIGQCCAKFLQTAERMSFASGVFFIMLGIYKLF
jgi:putative Mn2+ efflux pump MntP